MIFALMVIYFASTLNWKHKSDRIAGVWFVLLVAVLVANIVTIEGAAGVMLIP